MRKVCWAGLVLGLAAVAGCDSMNSEPNNNIPPSPKGIKHDSAPAPRDATSTPAGYPTGKSDASKDAAAPAPDAAKDAAPDAGKGEAPKADDAKGDMPKAARVNLSDKEIAAIKALPAADQAAALAQKVCPVGGGHLGAMGTPYKVSLEGKTVFLCCDGCEDDLKKDPQKYLAKVGK